MSTDATVPSTLFGGTWERIKGKFIWGIGDGETAGVTGGEKTHTLTTDEMPSHVHAPNQWAQVMSRGVIPELLGRQALKQGHIEILCPPKIIIVVLSAAVKPTIICRLIMGHIYGIEQLNKFAARAKKL